MVSFSSKKELQEAIKKQITSSDAQSIKAMLKVYEYQTSDEQESAGVYENNGVGFAGADAEILTSFCKQFTAKGFLSPKQMEIVKKKVGKYAAQITKQAINNGIYVKKEGKWVVAATVKEETKKESDMKKFEVEAEFESHSDYQSDWTETFVVKAKDVAEAHEKVKKIAGRCLITCTKEIG